MDPVDGSGEEIRIMDHQGKRKAAKAFAAAFAESLNDGLTTVTGRLSSLEIDDCPNPATPKGMPVHFRFSVEGSLSGEYFVEFYEPQITHLLSTTPQEPAAEFTDAHSETLAKVIASAAEGLAAAKQEEYGELRFRVERVSGLAFGGMFVVPLATSEEDADMQVMLYFGGQLLDNLALLQGSSTKSRGDLEAVAPHNLKMVMDVELNVSLRFGQRQLPLREVLDLTSGSVIELDRMADEPVELYLDGKLIARGEAVVVDGNYGLRVTEIPQPVLSYLTN
jgi:flagellar motor switch protein FliN/FliY